MRRLRVIFAGGGTGGHLFPALTIARALEKRFGSDNCDIMFVGTKRGIEYRMRNSLGFPLELIPVRGFNRALTLKNLLFPFVLIGALLKSQMLLNRFQPSLVVGCGGYVSGPIVSRAAARNITTVIQEQNSFPGFTTRKLAGKVDRVFIGFEEAKEFLPKNSNVIVSGNPVRESFNSATKADGLRAFDLDPSLKTLLVIGGSQGARSVNTAILANIQSLSTSLQLLWQTGQADYERVSNEVASQQTAKRIRVMPFTDKMELACAAADLAIARAGALTIAELEVSHTPAILIPYPHATGDHQTHNARSFANSGGAVVISDDDLKHQNPLSMASEMIESGELELMRRALLVKTQKQEKTALDIIVDGIVELLESRGKLS